MGVFCFFGFSIGTSPRAQSLAAWVVRGRVWGVSCAGDEHSRLCTIRKQIAVVAGSAASQLGGPWIIEISWSSSLPLGVSNCGETLCLWNWQCPKVAGSWSQEEVVVFPLAQFCGVTWELFLKSQLRCISLAFPSDSLSQLIICIKCFSF